MFKKKIILTSIIFLATLSCSSETTTPAKIIQPDNQIDLQQSSNQALDTTQNDNTKNAKIIKNEDKKSTPASDSIINENITLDELNICIKQLKNGKASSIDLINNEILKNLNSPFRNLLLKLYNHCFETGTYPWDTSVITPLHKKGDIRDPDNYRAIAVGSCVGKLYSTILLNRLIEFRFDFVISVFLQLVLKLFCLFMCQNVRMLIYIFLIT